MNAKLPRFEGRQVQVGTLRLTGRSRANVGSLSYGEEVFLIVRAQVDQVALGDAAIDGVDLFTRTHTVKATAIVLLDSAQGARMLDEAAMLAGERFGVKDLFHPYEDDKS